MLHLTEDSNMFNQQPQKSGDNGANQQAKDGGTNQIAARDAYKDCTIIESTTVSQAKDTETIMSLITYISQNAELQDGDLDSAMPDPENKIFLRFATYCSEIKNEIVESFFYAKAQTDAEDVIGLDKITVGKITAYLKRESRRMLRENNNDPMRALDKLTDFFEEILKKEKDSFFERNAIRYYLIGEIPKCNVFPNE